jgi:hypothetical protein
VPEISVIKLVAGVKKNYYLYSEKENSALLEKEK